MQPHLLADDHRVLGPQAHAPRDLAWVNPAYADPQVCHAARFTFDYQYEGCGNWPFNAAYAATYPDMQARRHPARPRSPTWRR